MRTQKIESCGNPFGPLFTGVYDAQGALLLEALRSCKIEDLGITGRNIEGWSEGGVVACLRWDGLGETSWWRRVEVPTKSYAIRIDDGLFEFSGRREFASQAKWERGQRRSRQVEKMMKTYEASGLAVA